MKPIDLRSDTVTKPTPEMRAAIAAAEVGDDVFGEDPTVNRLQARVAALLGKEAALYVSSGTQSNQLAIKSHTEPGHEIYCEENGHIFNYEAGAPAALSGVQVRPLPGVRGAITAAQIEAVLRPPDHHNPQSRLVVLENTHNRAGGAIFPFAEIEKIHTLTRQKGLALHLDGARLWNAHVATGIPLLEYGRLFDSISVCLSKGLGAPVGSVLTGSAEFIDRAHRYRKMWGGGMRQAGLLAAAGLYALDHHIARLADDHRHARQIADTFLKFPPIEVDLEATQTNIVIVELRKSGLNAPDLVVKLKDKGVLCLATAPTRLRLVTHLDADDMAITEACGLIETVLRNLL
ncbi:MAG TPA: low-specificity L-threonine aldolase [bacterium]|nr:low-specificity L-threonine aldolase [bacterium]HPR87124.1 low-specificity L-threonine aldolase [bacterium]